MFEFHTFLPLLKTSTKIEKYAEKVWERAAKKQMNKIQFIFPFTLCKFRPICSARTPPETDFRRIQRKSTRRTAKVRRSCGACAGKVWWYLIQITLFIRQIKAEQQAPLAAAASMVFGNSAALSFGQKEMIGWKKGLIGTTEMEKEERQRGREKEQLEGEMGDGTPKSPDPQVIEALGLSEKNLGVLFNISTT